MQKSPIREAIEKKIVDVINPPKNEIQKPSNRLWIAVVGFNLVFLVIDIVTAITVGVLTHWYYGVLVFFAGVLPMMAHEALFANPYASKHQRWISGTGFGFSIFAALSVGVMVVIINVLFDNTSTGKTLQAVAMALLFVIAVIHGGFLALYFFIDAGIRAIQNAMSAMAGNERKLEQIAMAEKIVDKSNLVIAKLEQRHTQGDTALMDAAMQSISGEWINDNHKTPIKSPNSPGRTDS